MFGCDKMSSMKKLKNDLYLVIGIIFLAFLFWLLPKLFQKSTPAVVKVIQNGQEKGTYSISEEQTLSIRCDDGGYNLLFIRNGEASISDADCRDRLCVRQRAISKKGESIICLPHKLVIQIEAKEESELDAVTY